MEIVALRNKIHSLIDSSDEDTLQSVYQLFSESGYTDAFKNMLEEEQQDYLRNKEVISKEEMDKTIQEIMSK